MLYYSIIYYHYIVFFTNYCNALKIIKSQFWSFDCRVHFDHLKHIPVLVLDGSLEFERDSEIQTKFITEV